MGEVWDLIILQPVLNCLVVLCSVLFSNFGLTIIALTIIIRGCMYPLPAGRLVYAEGRLRTRTWEGQDGQKHYRTEIIASRVTFLDRQASAALPEEKVEEKVEEEAEVGELEPEDIPF